MVERKKGKRYVARHVGDGVWALLNHDGDTETLGLFDGAQGMFRWLERQGDAWFLYYENFPAAERPINALDPLKIGGMAKMIWRDNDLIHWEEPSITP